MRMTVRVSGLRELDAALADMTQATARNVMRRALVKAGEPVAERARQLVPVRTGRLRDSIVVSTRLNNPVGTAAYAQAMRAGLGRAAAVQAKRDALRAAGQSFAEAYIGPGALPHAHLQEFGTAAMAPSPYLRPAWDEERNAVLDRIKDELRTQIEAAARRAARKAAKARTGG